MNANGNLSLRFLALTVAAIVLAPQSAPAGELGYRGAGQFTCEEWVSRDAETDRFVRSWIYGYWAGSFPISETASDAERIVYGDMFMKAVFEHCMKNRALTLFQAANHYRH